MSTDQTPQGDYANSLTDPSATVASASPIISNNQKHHVCAAVATWSFGALAIEECAPLLLSGCSAVDAVEKGINKVTDAINLFQSSFNFQIAVPSTFVVLYQGKCMIFL